MSEIYKMNDIRICKIVFQNMSNPELKKYITCEGRYQTAYNSELPLLILAHDLGTRNQNHQGIINKYS